MMHWASSFVSVTDDGLKLVPKGRSLSVNTMVWILLADDARYFLQVLADGVGVVHRVPKALQHPLFHRSPVSELLRLFVMKRRGSRSQFLISLLVPGATVLGDGCRKLQDFGRGFFRLLSFFSAAEFCCVFFERFRVHWLGHFSEFFCVLGFANAHLTVCAAILTLRPAEKAFFGQRDRNPGS